MPPGERCSLREGLAVLLAEPTGVRRDAMARVLGRDERVWCVVSVRPECDAMAGAARALQPDLVLAGLELWRQPGAVAQLRVLAPRARLLALVDEASAPYRDDAQRLQLDGVVEDSRITEQLSGCGPEPQAERP